MYKSIYNSPLGRLFLVSDGEFLVGSYLENQNHFPDEILSYDQYDELSVFYESKNWLDNYFQGENPSLYGIKILQRGTEFQNRVWRILLTTDYGQTLSYKDIAKIYCQENNIETMSFQAIGSAIGRNPLLIFVPCHRVIKQNGEVGKYVAGVDNKKYLLDLEKQVLVG